MARADLFAGQVRCDHAVADDISWYIRERLLPDALHRATGFRPDADDQPGVPRAGGAAADRAHGGVSIPAPVAGHWNPGAAPGMRRGGGPGRFAGAQQNDLVPSAGGAALLPAADRARLGAL